jgi:hypothetical protein
MSPEAGDDMSHLRYRWTLCYIAFIITLVFILQIMDAAGVIE